MMATKYNITTHHTGKKLNLFKGHTDRILSLFILENAKTNSGETVKSPLLFSAGADKTIRVWELVSGKHMKMFEGHDQLINSVVAGSFSDMSSLFPIVNTSSMEKKGGEEEGGHREEGVPLTLTETIDNVNVSGKGNKSKKQELAVTIVSASSDHSIRIWDLHTGYLLFELVGHTACVYDTVIIKVPKYYAAIVKDSEEGVGSAALTPGSNIILSCSDDSTIKLWSLATGTLIKTIRWHGVSVRGIDAGALVDTSQHTPVVIVSCGWDKSIQFHDFQHAIEATEKSCCVLS